MLFQVNTNQSIRTFESRDASVLYDDCTQGVNSNLACTCTVISDKTNKATRGVFMG